MEMKLEDILDRNGLFAYEAIAVMKDMARRIIELENKSHYPDEGRYL